MPYEFIKGHVNGNTPDTRVIDLRSDTISQPTEEMREAMFNAPVGDDVYGEDPTVEELLDKATALLGKEAACLVPSGTMANLIAIMVHCDRRGCEMISGHLSHTYRCEQGGPSQIAGVQSCILKNYDDGTFDLEEMEESIKVDPDCHEPYTKLIAVENTHNMCGGKVLPLEWLDELSKIAKKYNVAVHMDGARLMNAAVGSKVHPSRIVRDMDSVCICLSKGLGCPLGSILLGSQSFIDKAKRVRKVLGGGMRQTGIMAAAGLVALDKMIDRLADDHRHAFQVAKAVNGMNSKWIKVRMDVIQTNILMLYIDKTKVNAKDFLYRLTAAEENDSTKVCIRATGRDAGCIRLVFYWEITDEDVQVVIEKLHIVVDHFNMRMGKRTETIAY